MIGQILCKKHNIPLKYSKIQVGTVDCGWFCPKCNTYYVIGSPFDVDFLTYNGVDLTCFDANEIEKVRQLQATIASAEQERLRKDREEKRNLEREIKNEAKKKAQSRKEYRIVDVSNLNARLYWIENTKKCLADNQKLLLTNNAVKLDKTGFIVPVMKCSSCGRYYCEYRVGFSADRRGVISDKYLKKRVIDKPNISSKQNIPRIVFPAVVHALPQSAIVKCVLKDESENRHECVIVDKASDQSFQNGIVGRYMPIAVKILQAIALKNTEIEYADKKYSLVLQETSFINKYYEQAFGNYVEKTDVPKEIIVCKHIATDSDKNRIIPVTAMVWCAGSSVPVPINVYYSCNRDEYMISIESYRNYQEKYGLPFLKIVDEEYNGSQSEFAFNELREQSEMAIYGYSVSQTEGLSSRQREKLLMDLIDTGLMSKERIIRHLEWLIKLNRDKMYFEDAVLAWKSDLGFVNSYRMNDKRIIWASGFKSKGTDSHYYVKSINHVKSTNEELNFDKLLAGRFEELGLIDVEECSKEYGRKKVNTTIHEMERNLDAVEFEKGVFLSGKKMATNGLSKDILRKYREMVVKYAIDHRFFTGKMIMEAGLDRDVDENGFDEVFYNSLLRGDDRLNRCVINKQDIYSMQKREFSASDVIVDYVNTVEMVDLDELVHVLKEKYGFGISVKQVLKQVDGTPLYHDTILNYIYKDYETYYKDV